MHWLQIPVPLGWAAGFAVAAAGLGFWAGAGSNSANRQIDFRQMPVREIHFILDETDSRMFDFSQAAEKNDDYHLNIRYNYQGGF
ncbi:MAG: hypothetical protein P9L94_18615 [Candidatus Hinthialibacter antarcticus]|nr:hypothetical protein [Candidatus Hinthialibacter antarcticus]